MKKVFLSLLGAPAASAQTGCLRIGSSKTFTDGTQSQNAAGTICYLFKDSSEYVGNTVVYKTQAVMFVLGNSPEIDLDNRPGWNIVVIAAKVNDNPDSQVVVKSQKRVAFGTKLKDVNYDFLTLQEAYDWYITKMNFAGNDYFGTPVALTGNLGVNAS